jgi:type IV pilus assembly protein PilN
MVLGGVAQSNASVAEYMRNIEASPWMGQTDLSKTENSHDASRMPYAFGLTVALQKPKDDGDGTGQPASSSTAGSTAAPVAPATPQMKPANVPTPIQPSVPVKGGAK